MTERISRALGISAVLGCATIAQAGPDWIEGDHGDAGSLPGSAQTINMSGSATGVIVKISGRLSGTATALLGGSDFEDMYKFRITQPTAFCAATVCFDKGICGSAEFDSRLWLFNTNGEGIVGNDNAETIGVIGSSVDGSFLTGQACDGTGSMVLLPGDYYFAITGFNFPASAGGSIFCFGCSGSGTPTCTLGPTEISGPDGPGGGQPITEWQNNFSTGPGDGPCFGCGNYEVALCFDSVHIATPGAVEAKMDIKPGGCPNPFNRTSNGVLPVSLLGSATFDVHDVDLSSVRIKRADGIGGNLAPNEGPPGPHSVYDDNASPYTGVECGCTTLDGDGIVDLSMKFKSTDLVSALNLNSLSSGALVPLKVYGLLENGQAFEAQDCIRLVPPGTPPGMMAVKSLNSVFIDASPLDLTLDGGGFGNFQRTYPTSTVVKLKAPVLAPGKMFAGWKVDGNSQLITNQAIELTITSSTHTYEAVYVSVNLSR